MRVKICGITRAEDARLAAELGAAAVGFVFWPRSPRCIHPDVARAIVADLPAHVRAVGVFVDQPVEEVARVVRTVGLGAVQLHGREDSGPFEALGLPIIKAVAVGAGFVPASVATIPPTVMVLLDAHDPAKRGGTGRTIDWSLAARVAATRDTVLSGGLDPANVRAAIAQVRPYMIDVSSGVESVPGIKDPARLRALFREV
ncbi:phosphoribosylanthranilate isomerase [soil metagenome]